MDLRINQAVQTPIGPGVFMANFAVLDGDQTPVVKGRMVQVKLNDTNRDHIKDSNCLTPYAKQDALFVFQDADIATGKPLFASSEQGQGLIEFLLIILLVAAIVVYWVKTHQL